MAEDTLQRDTSQTPGSTTPQAEDSHKAAADRVSTASDTIGKARTMFQDGTQKLTQQAGDKVRAYAEDGKARAGTALDEFAKMMSDAAGSVDQRFGQSYGNYARSAADAVQGFSSSLKNKELDDLMADARSFVTKSPAVALGTAAAIGFVLARLAKSGIDANRDPD